MYGLYAWLASGGDAPKVVQNDSQAAAPTAAPENPAGRSIEPQQGSAAEPDRLNSASGKRPLSANAVSGVPAAVPGSEVAEPRAEALSEPPNVEDQVLDADASPEMEQPAAEPEMVASSPDSAHQEIPTPVDGALVVADPVPVPPEDDRLAVAGDLHPPAESKGDVGPVSTGTEALSSGSAAAHQAPPQEPAPEGRAAPALPKTAFQGGEIDIASPSVVRFTLASAIKNREPVSGLEAVRFDASGLAAVYAFSEVEGLSGRRLYYRWIHEGEQVARVRVYVGADRWRSHSSKFIDETMTGAWSVQLTDSDGRQLAEMNFTVHFQAPPGGQE